MKVYAWLVIGCLVGFVAVAAQVRASGAARSSVEAGAVPAEWASLEDASSRLASEVVAPLREWAAPGERLLSRVARPRVVLAGEVHGALESMHAGADPAVFHGVVTFVDAERAFPVVFDRRLGVFSVYDGRWCDAAAWVAAMGEGRAGRGGVVWPADGLEVPRVGVD